jgi:hypothetical protein
MNTAGGTEPAERSARLGHAIAAGLLAAVFLASFLDMAQWRVAWLPAVGDGEGSTLCLLRQLTGLPCPTCGLTRAFCSISRGGFAEAVAFHPLGPLVYVIFLALLVRSAGIAITGRMWLGGLARVLIISLPVLAIATLVIWVVRLGFMVSSGEAAAAWAKSTLGMLFT